MEDFFKKHNFIQNNLNRKNRRFNIIRYFPKIDTYEFINVGIVLYEDNKISYRLLQEDEVSKLSCPSLINSKVLKNSLESLNAFLQDKQSLNETIDTISNRYKNTLDTSFQLIYSGEESGNELIEKLFYDYIGYKFDFEEKISKVSKLVKKTKSIIDEEFRNYLSVKESAIQGYTIDFLNTKTKNIHHSLLGSIENSENISRAFIHAPAYPQKNQMYDFLNTKESFMSKGNNNREKLLKLNINVYSYYNDESIVQYCESML